MMMIKRDYSCIEMHGHAADKIPCAMMTALSVSLIKNITERLKEDADFRLDKGVFFLNTMSLSLEAMSLVDAFWYSVQNLANDYPTSFCIGTDVMR